MIVQDSAYAEIAITTNFSFLRGASHPRELAEAAVRHGLAAIGIADRNSLAGIVRAYQALIDIKPQTDLPVPKLLVGVRLVFVDGTPDILVYPVDRAAYGRLCRLLSKGKLRAPKGECILTLSDLLKWQDGFLLVVLPPHPGKTCVEIAPPTKTWNRELPEVQQEQPRIHFEAALRAKPDDIRMVLKQLSAIARERVWLGAYMPYRGDDERRRVYAFGCEGVACAT
jgi:error-prone DNA polymerase